MAEGQAADLIARGDELMQTGDADGALREYERAVAVDSASGEAVKSVALALAGLGRKEEGVERLLRAAGARTWDARGLVRLADGLVALRVADTARALAHEATEQKEQWRADVALAADLAWTWIRLGDPGQGLAVLEAVGTARETDAFARWTTGRCLTALDRHQEALAEYDAARVIEPEEAIILFDAATSLHALDRDDDALDHARKARRAGGLAVRAQLELVDLLDALGADADAGELLDELTRTEAWQRDRPAAVEVASALLLRNRPSDAIAVLDAVLADATWAASDDANEAITWRARCLAIAGDASRAVRDFETLEARGARVTDPNDQARAGLAYSEDGRPDAALSYLDGIADSVGEPLRIPVLLHAGMAQVQLGRQTEAVTPLRRAHSLAAVSDRDPGTAGTVALFLAIAVGNEDLDEQARLLDEADRLLPADSVNGRAVLDLQRAGRAVGDQRWDDVLELTDGLVERLEPADHATARYFRGLALAHRGRLDDALRVLDAALAAGSTSDGLSVAVRIVRGRVHQARADHELAREDFCECLTLIDDPAQQRWLHIRVAGCDLALGEPNAALASLDRLADEDPPVEESPDYWELRANTLLGLDRFSESLAAMERLAELNPAKRRLARFFQFGVGAFQPDWSEMDDAVAELVQAPPAEADTPLDWLITAQARAFANRPDAGEALDEAVRRDPTVHDSALGRQTRMLIAAGQGDLAAFEDAAPVDDNTQIPAMRVFVHQMRAATLIKGDHDPHQAIAEFVRVAELADQSRQLVTDVQAVPALVRQAQLHLTLDEVDEARKALERAEEFIARQGQSPGALGALIIMGRAAVLMQSDGLDRALEELDGAAAYVKSLPHTLQAVLEAVRGHLLRLRGDDEMALAALRRAAELDPTESRVLRDLAALQTDMDEHEAAVASIELAEKALAHTTDDGQRADLARLHSIALRRMGRLEAALEAARRAVAMNRDDGRAWMTLGDAYYALDRLAQAKKAYRRGWLLSPDDERTGARSLVGLTSTMITVGEFRAALDALESRQERQRIARLSRTYGAISFNRAVALLRCDDEERALREITAAANAEHPVPQAADLARRMAKRRAQENSWLGYWLLDREGGRMRRLAGAALLVLLIMTTIVAIADPTRIGWLGWASPQGNHRVVALLVIAALLLLPIATKLKFGSVEIEQPQPAMTDIPELQPTSADDVLEDLTSVLAKAAPPLAGAGAAKNVPTAADTSSLDGLMASQELPNSADRLS